jgi:hypothetical protein
MYVADDDEMFVARLVEENVVSTSDGNRWSLQIAKLLCCWFRSHTNRFNDQTNKQHARSITSRSQYIQHDDGRRFRQPALSGRDRCDSQVCARRHAGVRSERDVVVDVDIVIVDGECWRFDNGNNNNDDDNDERAVDDDDDG